MGSSGALLSGSSSQPPLSSIAERASGSGEESEEEDEEEEGPWKTADKSQCIQDSVNEGVIKSGYLWKKGERRKVRVLNTRVLHRLDGIADVEEEMVCTTAGTSGVLQDVCRVQATPTAQSRRGALVHTGRAEETPVHVWGGHVCADVLFADTEPRGRAGLGRGHPGGTRDADDDIDTDVVDDAGA